MKEIIEEYKKAFNLLKENMYLDKEKNLRVKNALCFGKGFPTWNEDNLFEAYQYKLKDILKSIREGNQNNPREPQKIYLNALFELALPTWGKLGLNENQKSHIDLEKITQKEFYFLKLNRLQEIQVCGAIKKEFNLEIEIPSYMKKEVSEKLEKYSKTIDQKIIHKLQQDEKGLKNLFKEKRTFPEINYSFEFKDPRIETLRPLGASQITFRWGDDLYKI